MIMIKLENVTKTYINGDQSTTVLHDVSFEIKEKEYVAIMGPSGSGKSTLMHIIGGLDTPTSGTYRLEGKNVSALTQNELAEIRKSHIGFVFQAFHLLPRASAMRNVILPLMYAKVPRTLREERARQALLSAGLDETKHKNLSSQLSGGQMQRVAIARALALNPAIILADEPTGNLDSKTGDLVLATFQRLHESGKTIVLITHESYVAEHAKRIIVVRDGIIVEDRKNEKVKTMDSHRSANPDDHRGGNDSVKI